MKARRGARSRAHPLRVALLLGAALAAIGCSSRCGSRKQAEATDAAVVEARVEMVDHGAEPRRELAIGRWTGLDYRLVMINEMSFGVQGQKPHQLPTSVGSLRYRVQRGTADPLLEERGGRKLRLVEEEVVLDVLRVEDKNLAPSAIEQFNRALAGFQGSSVRQLVNEDGEVVEISTLTVGKQKPPPEVADLLDEAWEVQRRFPFRLPVGAVGVGARWRFSDPIRLRGVRATQVADMTVLSIDEERVRLRMRIRMHAPRQEIPHPTRPGDTAVLEQYRGDGDGELTFDRMTAILLEARLSTTASLRLSVDTEQGLQVATYITANTLRGHGAVGAGDAAPAEPLEAPPAHSATPDAKP